MWSYSVMGYLEVRNVILLDYALILSKYKGILEPKISSQNKESPLYGGIDKIFQSTN